MPFELSRNAERHSAYTEIVNEHRLLNLSSSRNEVSNFSSREPESGTSSATSSVAKQYLNLNLSNMYAKMPTTVKDDSGQAASIGVSGERQLIIDQKSEEPASRDLSALKNRLETVPDSEHTDATDRPQIMPTIGEQKKPKTARISKRRASRFASRIARPVLSHNASAIHSIA